MRLRGGMLAPVLKHTVFLAALLCLTGCSAFAAPHRVTSQRVVIPQCLPVMAGGTEQWTGSELPQNTSAFLGFRPLVFAHIPADMTWSGSVGFGSQWKRGPAPLFHGAYGHLVPRPYNTLAMENIVAIDESPQNFGPLTNMAATGATLHVTNQSVTTMNGRNVTLFHFATSGDSSHSVMGVGLLWRTDTLTIRVTAVTSGEYQMRYSGSEPSESFDQIRAWSGVDTGELMTLASTLMPWPGCGGS